MSPGRGERFRAAVYALVRRVPRGSVVTYGQVAAIDNLQTRHAPLLADFRNLKKARRQRFIERPIGQPSSTSHWSP